MFYDKEIELKGNNCLPWEGLAGRWQLLQGEAVNLQHFLVFPCSVLADQVLSATPRGGIGYQIHLFGLFGAVSDGPFKQFGLRWNTDLCQKAPGSGSFGSFAINSR